MVFSSFVFLFRFLPAVLILYAFVPWKNGLLFLASLFFYAWGEPVYVVLMLFSTAVDFFHGKKVEELIKRGEKRRAKGFVASSVVINLALLGFFKYGDFIIENINRVFGAGFTPLSLPLPIGISFYTFQTMSYTIDIYRGKARAQKNMISFGTYVALFPQLVAGPIVRYQSIEDQLSKRRTDWTKVSEGAWRFVIGLAKKVLLANTAGLLWNRVLEAGAQEMSQMLSWLGIGAFTLQIYFDFSGYSDMAIGLGKIFGFTFPENFDYPYESKSITEFWRRWHMTLGEWFREYVYIPLGGNRRGKGIWMRNLLIVWMLTGFWHGASWNFMLWGLYFGGILMLEKLWLGTWLKRAPALLTHLYVMVLVILGWVLFSFENLSQAFSYMRYMAGIGVPAVNSLALYELKSFGLLMLLMCAGCTALPARTFRGLKEKRGAAVCFMAAVFLWCLASLLNASYNPFLYFRF